jgi:hypothetical protein
VYKLAKNCASKRPGIGGDGVIGMWLSTELHQKTVGWYLEKDHDENDTMREQCH